MRRKQLRSVAMRAAPYMPLALVVLVAILATLFRLVDLGQPQLNRDEAASWYLSSRPLSELLARSSYETFPPLYPLLLKAWMLLFGESEAAVRSLSIAAWLGLVFVTYGFARQAIGRWPGVLAAVLVALSPAILENSLLARMYTLEALFTTAAWWLAWRLIADGEGRSRKRRMTIAMALGATVACEVWTMSLGLPSAGLQLVFGLTSLLRLRTRTAGLACLAVLVGASTLLPWIPNLVGVAGDKIPFWTPRPDLLSLMGTIGWWLQGGLDGGWIVLAVAGSALGLLGAITIYRTSPSAGSILVIALTLASGLVIAAWVYSQVRSIYDQRYFGSAFPAFAILISAGAAGVLRWVRDRSGSLPVLPRASAVALTVGLVLPMVFGSSQSAGRFQSEQGIDPAQQTIELLSTLVRPGDVVMTLNAQSYFPLEYYLTRTGEAKSLGIELYHWHRPTAAFFTGWRDIDPTRVIDLETVATTGWTSALHIRSGSRIWLVTLNNPDYEYPRFVPAQTGSLKILDSTILHIDGGTAEIWESIPGSP